MSHVFIAVCTLGKVRVEWAVNFATSAKPSMRDNYVGVIAGFTIRDARNTAVKAAITSGADYLLFWDDDLAPCDSNAASVLISTADQLNLDVLGGVYPMRRDPPEPCVAETSGGGPYWGWRDGKIHEVFMVGTAFMAIRTAALERMTVENYVAANGEQLGSYFDLPQIQSDQWSGSGRITDDFYFADVCQRNGIKQHVHGGILCDQIDLDGRVYRIEPQVELV